MSFTPAKFDIVRDKYAAIASEEKFLKEGSFATQLLHNNSYLADCDETSIIQAVFNTALTDLTLNPVSKIAYLVPRKVKRNGRWVKIACLEPSYMGLVKLITDTGSANQVYSHCVYEGDVFEIDLGFETNLKHSPKFKSKTITGCYAVAVLADGSRTFEYMDIEDLHAIREKSESYKAFIDPTSKTKSCIWDSHPQEMCRKTVIRRLCKYLPKTNQWDRVNEAISLDESDYRASDEQVLYALSLIDSSNLDHHERDEVRRNIHTMTPSEVSGLITRFKDNQLLTDADHLESIKQEINAS